MMMHRGEYQSQGDIDIMSSVQINVGISPIIASELDQIVGTGFFRDRTEAVNEALKFLIHNYKTMKIAEQIESPSKNVETAMCLTDALMSSWDGGDL
jgi:Arc/MetJ-type ribon-helix-helix transcriptional regulator